LTVCRASVLPSSHKRLRLSIHQHKLSGPARKTRGPPAGFKLQDHTHSITAQAVLRGTDELRCNDACAAWAAADGVPCRSPLMSQALATWVRNMDSPWAAAGHPMVAPRANQGACTGRESSASPPGSRPQAGSSTAAVSTLRSNTLSGAPTRNHAKHSCHSCRSC
jgi:hypothetical protein